MIKPIIALGCLALLAGCADTSQVVRTGGTAAVAKLDAHKVVYISVPQDGRYHAIQYPGSGQTTAEIVATAFSSRAQRVETGHDPEVYDQGLASAKKVGAAYYVQPTILHWEHRATEWSGLPNRVSVKLLTTDVATGKTIDSMVVSGKSGLATLGGDKPEDLLPKPIQAYVNSLY